MSEFEIKIIQALRDIATNFFDGLFEIITFLGEKEILIVLLIFTYFAYSKKAGQRIAFAIFSSLLINNTLKGIIKRPRPWTHPNATFEPVRGETATGASFPSGHTQNAAVTYTSLALIFRNKIITAVIGILIFLIGFSRMYLGVHYPSDVIAGLILGIGCAVIGCYIHQKCECSFRKQYLLYLIVLLVFLPFIFVFWHSDYNQILVYRDFYTSYAFFAGYIIGVGLEYRFINFVDNASIIIKITRTVIALLLTIGIMFGLKYVFPNNNIICDMIRYFLIPVIGLGLFPILGKSVLFSTNKN